MVLHMANRWYINKNHKYPPVNTVVYKNDLLDKVCLTGTSDMNVIGVTSQFKARLWSRQPVAWQVITPRGKSTTISLVVGHSIKLIADDFPFAHSNTSAYLKSHERSLFMQMIAMNTQTRGAPNQWQRNAQP